MSGPVWLGTPAFASLLSDYRSKYPDVRLDVDLSGRMVNLVEEGFDLALRVSANLGQSLIVRPIAAVRFQLVGSPAYLHRAGRPLVATHHAALTGMGLAFLPQLMIRDDVSSARLEALLPD